MCVIEFILFLPTPLSDTLQVYASTIVVVVIIEGNTESCRKMQEKKEPFLSNRQAHAGRSPDVQCRQRVTTKVCFNHLSTSTWKKSSITSTDTMLWHIAGPIKVCICMLLATTTPKRMSPHITPTPDAWTSPPYYGSIAACLEPRLCIFYIA